MPVNGTRKRITKAAIVSSCQLPSLPVIAARAAPAEIATLAIGSRPPGHYSSNHSMEATHKPVRQSHSASDRERKNAAGNI